MKTKKYSFESVTFLWLVFCILFFTCNLYGPQEREARRILTAAGVQGGLVIHLGCGDGKLTAALYEHDGYLVHGLDRDVSNVKKARQYIQSKQLYGPVSIDQLSSDHLPYIDNLANLVISKDLGQISMDEVMRVLCPEGVAYIKKSDSWTKIVKPRPADIDDWTHYLYDAGGNPVSHDRIIGPPRSLQWMGSPRWSRHHDRMASMSALVSTNGRIFYIFDEGPTSSIILPSEWFLIARDAFNGTILWKQPIDRWHTRLWPLKSGPAQLPRRLIAIDDRVYVTLGIEAPVSVLDAATGNIIHTYEGTRCTEEMIMSDDVLFLLVNPDSTKWQTFHPTRVDRPGTKNQQWSEAKEYLMAVRADTREILWKKEYRVLPLTMAADSKGVFFHDGEKVVCLDRATGNQLWTSQPLPRWSQIMSFFGPTLLVHKDVVLFAGGENMIMHRHGWDTMTALSSETGEVLWTAEHPPSGYQSPEDILVAGDIVWTAPTTNTAHSGIFTGRDLYTGEVINQIPPEIETYWFHHRCYRSKATDQYLMTSRTGIEFIDTHSNNWTINHWVRGGCLYGIMPCNGLVYTPPHDCACYPEAKLYGFCALAPESKSSQQLKKIPDDSRLQRGVEFVKLTNAASAESVGDDWPTYRHDATRSGFTRTPIPQNLTQKWKTHLGGKLSSAVVAGKKLFIAQVNAHTIYALDTNNGKILWQFTTGGRVDSPPTYYKGMVLFGSADGWIYCLRASDGEMIWRYIAAPMDLRLSGFEQLESVWPVHGSVLIQDDVVYCVAGRSMFLDEGIRLYRLDPESGRKLSEVVLNDLDPETGKNLQNRIKILNMPVALPDILSSDGKYIYMRSQRFDMKGVRQGLGPHSGNPSMQGSVQQGEGKHIFCPFGFLDDSWFHRSYWVYGKSFAGGHAGYYQAGKYTPGGRILVCDQSSVYGFGRKQQYYRWTSPLEYHLFAVKKSQNIGTKEVTEGRRKGWLEPDKEMEYIWFHTIPMLVRAMVVSEKTLFIAGPPDVVDEEEAVKRLQDPEMQDKLAEQSAALKGERGASLWAISTSDGSKLAEYELDSPPIFDGMAAAYGQLYMATCNGKVLCFEGKE